MSYLTFAPRALRRARATLLVLALPLVAGCYRLTPIESRAMPERGTDLRINLTDEGAVRLAPLIGPRVEVLEAKTLEGTDSSLALAVSQSVSRTGAVVRWNGERLEVPRHYIERMQTRQLDRRRTWLASGAGVVGVILLSQIFDWSRGDDVIPGRGPVGGPAESRVP